MNLFYFSEAKSELTEEVGRLVCFVSVSPKDTTPTLHLWGEQRTPIEFVQQECLSRIYFGSIDIGKLTATMDGGIALEGGGYVVLDCTDDGKNRMLFDNLKWLLRRLQSTTPANRIMKVDARLIELILNQPAFDSNEWVQCYQDLEPVGNELFDWLWITTDDFELRSKELSTAFRKIYGQERFDLFFQLMVNIKFSIMSLEEMQA